MRNRTLAFFALAFALSAAFVLPRVPAALAGVELFKVTGFEIEGARYLTLEEAVASVAVPGDANVWDDAAEWETRLASHPLVKTARIGRHLPGTLVLRIVEREPVALVPMPTLEAVDSEGNVLPLDLSLFGLDLPLLGVTATSPPAPETVAVLAAEVERIRMMDPEFLARMSELVQDEDGDLIARWTEPQVSFRFPASVPASRLREAQAVLADASQRSLRAPTLVDLRFADQVVIGRRP